MGRADLEWEHLWPERSEISIFRFKDVSSMAETASGTTADGGSAQTRLGGTPPGPQARPLWPLTFIQGPRDYNIIRGSQIIDCAFTPLAGRPESDRHVHRHFHWGIMVWLPFIWSHKTENVCKSGRRRAPGQNESFQTQRWIHLLPFVRFGLNGTAVSEWPELPESSTVEDKQGSLQG